MDHRPRARRRWGSDPLLSIVSVGFMPYLTANPSKTTPNGRHSHMRLVDVAARASGAVNEEHQSHRRWPREIAFGLIRLRLLTSKASNRMIASSSSIGSRCLNRRRWVSTRACERRFTSPFVNALQKLIRTQRVERRRSNPIRRRKDEFT